MYRITGVEPSGEPMTFGQARSLLAPDDADRMPSLRESVLEHGGPITYEYRLLRPDGEVRNVMAHGELWRDAEGLPISVVGALQDVTERRKLERSLEQRTLFLREIIDAMPTLVAVKDRQSRRVIVNKAYAEFFGTSTAAIEVGGVVPGLDPALDFRMRAEDEQILAGAQRLEVFDEALNDALGRNRRLASSKRRLQADGEEYVLYIGVDVTDRQQAEMRQREMEKMAALGQLAARVAHEINNPLAGIKGAFELVKRGVPEDFEHRPYVELVDREIRRISDILRKMYDLYRPRATANDVVALEPMLDDIRAVLEPSLNDRGVTLRTQLTAEASKQPVWESLLRPMLFSLLQNAIEATPMGSVVTLTGGVEQEWLELRVRDQGPGIPREIRERIFEPFFTTKTYMATSGMGLGLAIAKTGAEALGGTITLETTDGDGAEFMVRIMLSALP
jgi:PAS domain S-box-containing protein